MKIYTLKDPITDKVRYVGVTTQKLNQRLSQHLNSAKNNECRHVCKWIRTLTKQNLKPIIEQIDEVPDENWEETEKFYIKQYRNAGYNLTNISEGGYGVITAEMRSKSSIERSAEGHKKPIYQLDTKLNIIKEWKSIVDASKELSIGKSNISNALCYKRAACGFFWCRVSEYTSDFKPSVKYINEKGKGIVKI